MKYGTSPDFLVWFVLVLFLVFLGAVLYKGSQVRIPKKNVTPKDPIRGDYSFFQASVNVNTTTTQERNRVRSQRIELLRRIKDDTYEDTPWWTIGGSR